MKPLWTCPKCGAKFVSANMWHSCGRFRVADLFAGSDPRVLRLYRRFRRMVESCGPVIVIPQKTRLVFMVRMRFAGVSPRKAYLRVGMMLTRPLAADPRLEKVERYGPFSVGNYFRIEREAQLDASMQSWLREAYDRGCQKHLTASRRPERAVRRKSRLA